MSKIKLFLFLTLSFYNLKAQDSKDFESENLVTNPSFEEIEDCPTSYGTIDFATGWLGLKFTPDLFSACAEQSKVKTPQNFFGYQKPATGNNYVGILAYHDNTQKEYITSNFTKPLERGKAYYVSLKWSLAEDYSNFACNNLGILFTNNIDNIEGRIIKPQVQVKEFLENTDDWQVIQDTIITEDNYDFIVIGNFQDKAGTSTKTMKKDAYPAAYYFIDDIEVREIDIPVIKNGFIKIKGKIEDIQTQKSISNAKVDFVLSNIKYRAYEESNSQGVYEFSNMQKTTKFLLQVHAEGYHSQSKIVEVTNEDEIVADFHLEPSKLGSTIVLENIVFETGKSILHPKSFHELDMIAEFLKTHPHFHVEIGGHTDSTGDDKLNLQLSENRANAVMQYLIEHGIIDEKRLVHKGYGERKPIAPNDTEANRLKNRRVELKIVKD